MKHGAIKGQKTAYTLTTVAGFLLIVAILFTALQFSVNDRSWFEQEYRALDLESAIGLSTSDITDALMRLVDYMEGRASNIQLVVRENGLYVNMYNEREIAHMEDVRALYQAWRSVRTWGLVLAFVLIFAAFFLDRKELWFNVSRGFLRASMVFLVLVVALGVFAAVDFTAFWNGFHYLFFDNDLWLLSPARDRMIRICPQQLFWDLIVRTFSTFILAFAVLMAASSSIYFVHKTRHAYGH